MQMNKIRDFRTSHRLFIDDLLGPDSLVAAACYQAFPIRTEGNTAHVVSLSFQSHYRSPVFHVPKFDRTITTGRGYRKTVRTEGYNADLTGVSRQNLPPLLSNVRKPSGMTCPPLRRNANFLPLRCPENPVLNDFQLLD